MIDFGTIFVTVGLLSLIEGIFILLFPDWTKNTITSLMKNSKIMKRVGMIEIIIAVVLLIIGIVVR